MDGTLIEAAASLKSFKPRDADPPPDDGDRGNPSVDFHGERRAKRHSSEHDRTPRRDSSGRASNCVGSQAIWGFQGVPCRSMALRTVSSLCIHAVSATFGGLPAFTSRS